MSTPDSIAHRLVQAYQQQARIQVDPTNGPDDMPEAYSAQRLVWNRLVGDERQSVWKVGPAPDQAEPLAAPVFPQRFGLSPAVFPPDLFNGIGVEAEIAFRFGRDLPVRTAPSSREEIVEAIASAHVAMELVDSRLADPQAAGPEWRLADNLLNGVLILGDAIANWREVDWRDLPVEVHADGHLIDGRAGNPPRNDLFLCLPWWVAHVGGVRAGDVVTTGAWTGMHRLHQARDITVAFPGLGACQVRIEGEPGR